MQEPLFLAVPSLSDVHLCSTPVALELSIPNLRIIPSDDILFQLIFSFSLFHRVK